MKGARRLLGIAVMTTALFVVAFVASFVVSGAMRLAITDGHASHSAPEGEP